MYYKVMAVVLAFPWLLLAFTVVGYLRSKLSRTS